MRKYILFSIIAFCALWFFNSAAAQAATINAASCNLSDVQAAVNNAIGGDIVKLPATCIATWTTQLELNKAITLQGNGTTVNIITINNPRGGGVGNGIRVSGISSGLVRITGFRMNVYVADWYGGILVAGNPSPAIFRMDNMYLAFTGPAYRRGLAIVGTKAVVDNNTFYRIGTLVEGFSWADGPRWGTDEAVFFEDNLFDSNDPNSDVDCSVGGRVVYRYNTFNIMYPGTHGRDTVTRGCIRMDVYNNTINSLDQWTRGVQFRGGTGVIYNNIFTGTFGGTDIMLLQNYCSDNTGYYACGMGSCGVNGYPCPDQVGYGQGTSPSQVSYPVYEWGNCKNALGCANNGADDVNFVVDWREYQPTHIQVNRDFFKNTVMPGYEVYVYPHPLRSDAPVQTCTYTYSAWSACQSNNTQSRTVISSSPSGCTGTPILIQSCVYTNFLPEQYIQAESGILSGMQTGIAGSDTYIYAASDNSGLAVFTFNITAFGQYKMEALVNSNNDAGQNSFYVGLDNESAQGNNTYTYSLPLVSSFAWDDVNKVGNGTILPEFDPMIWNLTAGLHAFTFYGREANTWLDQIILKRVTADTTPPAAPTGVSVN